MLPKHELLTKATFLLYLRPPANQTNQGSVVASSRRSLKSHTNLLQQTYPRAKQLARMDAASLGFRGLGRKVTDGSADCATDGNSGTHARQAAVTSRHHLF